MKVNTPGLWTAEMEAVAKNFGSIIDKVRNLSEPSNGKENYSRLKSQLVFSMLYYTTDIISSGFMFVLQDQLSESVQEVLEHLFKLQKVLLEFSAPANESESICKRFKADQFYWPSPLVIYLKMAVSSRGPDLDLESVRQLIKDLKLEHIANKTKFYPGVPRCIMALIGSRYGQVISASKDSYDFDRIQALSTKLWEDRRGSLQEKRSTSNSDRFEQLTKLSEDFVAKVNEQTGRGKNVKLKKPVNINDDGLREFLDERASHVNQKKIDLSTDGSLLATWKPNGDPYPSCLLDYYRFTTNRPDYNQTPSRDVFGATSCAEWYGYIEVASSVDVIPEKPLPNASDFVSDFRETHGVETN